jgi:hypothetical protein
MLNPLTECQTLPTVAAPLAFLVLTLIVKRAILQWLRDITSSPTSWGED